jgi:ABC-type nitrate/sulfonate/bicarbonate transport system substrate-binding protein
MTVRRIALFACSLAAVLAVGGCGARKETRSPGPGRPLHIALAPLNVGENAVFAALAGDQFRAAGLDVRLSVSADAATAIRQVEQGKADLAVGTQPDLLEARGRGARVVSVAALVQGPFTSLIAPKLSPATVLALATKPIGTQGLDYQQAFAETIFQKANVVNVGSDLAGALASKKVGAVIAPFGGPSLPRGVGVVPVDHLKVPTYSEYVLVAREDAIGRNGDTIRSLIGALARGTHDLAGSQKFRIAIPLKGAEVARIRALMLPPPGRPYGWQEAARWRAFAAWMKAHRLAQKGSAGAFTNAFLPGQGI